jgi:cob(I)alamin adenosyltransferase
LKIYTRTGDSGTTGLIGGGRVVKNSPTMEAIGDVDELNAAIGFARCSAVADAQLDSELAMIQNLLFDMGAELASPPGHARTYRAISQQQVASLEDSIDAQTQDLEPLRAFILPGGSELAARLHLARCVCRRAERSILELNDHDSLSPEVLAFINRLSDWLFTAARTANRRDGVQDVEWRRIGD